MPNQRRIWPFRIPSANREVQLIILIRHIPHPTSPCFLPFPPLTPKAPRHQPCLTAAQGVRWRREPEPRRKTPRSHTHPGHSSLAAARAAPHAWPAAGFRRIPAAPPGRDEAGRAAPGRAEPPTQPAPGQTFSGLRGERLMKRCQSQSRLTFLDGLIPMEHESPQDG